MKKIIITLAAVLCCATTVVNAQSSVEDLLKSAEQKAKLADKNPENGKMQYLAAMAFIDDELGEKKDFDRAQTYAYRAYQIAQEHPALQDTLKGLSCQALSMIYAGKQSWDNALDFMDMTMDAFEEELGKSNPATNGVKLTYGNLLLKVRPVRSFLRIQEASPLIVCDENFQFKLVPIEEKDKYGLDYHFTYDFENPHYIDFRDCSAGIIFVYNPDKFNEIITKYREFKDANK